MRTTTVTATLMLGFGSLFGVLATQADETKPAATATRTDAALIASAMRAAPRGVAKKATIVDMGADGKMRTLRKGTNGFTCMAGKPNTLGLDSMCMDANAMEWASAWMTHKSPPVGKLGLMYMLAGDAGASNTDPFATGPTPTNHFIKTSSHVMVVGGDANMLDSYPKGADPDVTAPYVMWVGTQYQHLMLPVK